MRNFKNTVAAIALLAVLAFTTTTANAGLILSDLTGGTTPSPCETKPAGPDSGILLSDLLDGIIVAGFTGIIVAGKDGIIVAGKDGIIVAGKDGGCTSK